MTGTIPHLRVVVAVTGFVLCGFAAVSAAVFLSAGIDPATKGSIIEAWKNFALLAVGFWIGSSSGGKAKSEAPQPVVVDQPADKPVPVEAQP